MTTTADSSLWRTSTEGHAGQSVPFRSLAHAGRILKWTIIVGRNPIVAAVLELERLPHRVLDVTAVNHCC
jgi:hypothetical protein